MNDFNCPFPCSVQSFNTSKRPLYCIYGLNGSCWELLKGAIRHHIGLGGPEAEYGLPKGSSGAQIYNGRDETFLLMVSLGLLRVVFNRYLV